MRIKKNFVEKINQHKTEIIITSVTVVSAIGIILLMKNGDVIKEQIVSNFFKKDIGANENIFTNASEVGENLIIKALADKKIVDVSTHIRNLPNGWKASTVKLESAIENGIMLGTNQTWVDNYSKACA